MRKMIVRGALTGFVVAAAIILIRKLHNKSCISVVGGETVRKLAEENRHNPDFVILDVRTLPEYMEGHIDVALPMDFHSRTFMDEVNKLDKNKTYLVYSVNMGRSRKAAHIMSRLGFNRVRVLAGGYSDWTRVAPSVA